MTGPELGLLLKAAAVGFAVSAPIGPIGVLCIRRTLLDGPRAGLAVGLGAATVDGIFAAVAAFGLTVISTAVLPWETGLRLAGGLFLLALAYRAARARPRLDRPSTDRGGVASAYASGFALLGANPIAIVFFSTVFASFGLRGVTGVSAGATIVMGVVFGAASWWMVLTAATLLVRSRLDTGGVRLINLGSAALLAGFGVLVIAEVLI